MWYFEVIVCDHVSHAPLESYFSPSRTLNSSTHFAMLYTRKSQQHHKQHHGQHHHSASSRNRPLYRRATRCRSHRLARHRQSLPCRLVNLSKGRRRQLSQKQHARPHNARRAATARYATPCLRVRSRTPALSPSSQFREARAEVRYRTQVTRL